MIIRIDKWRSPAVKDNTQVRVIGMEGIQDIRSTINLFKPTTLLTITPIQIRGLNCSSRDKAPEVQWWSLRSNTDVMLHPDDSHEEENANLVYGQR